MKSATLPKGFPNSPETWEKLIAEAPGEDRSPTKVEEAQWANAVVSHSLPELHQQLAKRRRGPARSPLKVSTTIRFDAEVLAALKASGKGWQTRVNEALKDWLKTQSPT